MATKLGPGRPRSSSVDKRDVISSAAVRLFSELGYERTTIRAVALEAGVDPKLVMHYFGNKVALFVQTMAMPETADRAIALLKVTPKHLAGKALAEALFASQKSGEDLQLVGIIRAASSEPEAGQMVREAYVKKTMMRIVDVMNLDNPELRAMMLATVVAGFVFTSRIVPLQDLTRATEKQRKAILGRVIGEILMAKI